MNKKKNPINKNQGWKTHPSKVQGKWEHVDTTQRKNKGKQSTKNLIDCERLEH